MAYDPEATRKILSSGSPLIIKNLTLIVQGHVGIKFEYFKFYKIPLSKHNILSSWNNILQHGFELSMNFVSNCQKLIFC